MSMWSTSHVYSGILMKLYGAKERRAEVGLKDRLTKGISNGEKTKVVILDEIDQFINDQSFLYNILEWLTIGAKLLLVFISNVIDLTIRLDSKIQSRLKFETIIFKPYNYHQI